MIFLAETSDSIDEDQNIIKTKSIFMPCAETVGDKAGRGHTQSPPCKPQGIDDAPENAFPMQNYRR